MVLICAQMGSPRSSRLLREDNGEEDLIFRAGTVYAVLRLPDGRGYRNSWLYLDQGTGSVCP